MLILQTDWPPHVSIPEGATPLSIVVPDANDRWLKDLQTPVPSDPAVLRFGSML